MTPRRTSPDAQLGLFDEPTAPEAPTRATPPQDEPIASVPPSAPRAAEPPQRPQEPPEYSSMWAGLASDAERKTVEDSIAYFFSRGR